MQCAIYVPQETDTYLYLSTSDDFSHVPELLLKLIGEPVHVMDLDHRRNASWRRRMRARRWCNLQERAGIYRCRAKTSGWARH
ncbi:MAG: YcgL domain-containing protein [Candidatus Competibacteraceae bacterium]